MSLLDGRTVAVTGGANGLGAGIVRRFHAEGARGFVVDLPSAADRDVPPGWRSIGVDVRDDKSVAAAFEQVSSIDVLVAAAGVVPGWTPVAELDLDEWDDVFRVNVRGMISTFKHARLTDGGAIVAIGSLNSWRGDPNIAGYVASKHAVLGIVRSAALELGRRGIRVNALGPGPIATGALLARMQRRERELGLPVEEALAAAARQTALGRMATIDEVAAAALFLASDLSSGITGHLLPVDAGIA
ncbi:MAG: SDR family oxidoreductase [Thermoleophilia bacterium]|nr:SDR family oxidoreductase [Thermoleophilia bacterium]